MRTAGTANNSSVKQAENYSISLNNPSSTSNRTGSNGQARKKMKPYQSTKTRRMPDNSALPVKYSSNPKQEQYQKPN